MNSKRKKKVEDQEKYKKQKKNKTEGPPQNVFSLIF